VHPRGNRKGHRNSCRKWKRCNARTTELYRPDPGVLDSYEIERRQAGERNVGASRDAAMGCRSWRKLCGREIYENSSQDAAARGRLAAVADGLPAIAAPIGLTAEGLPVALQIIGPRGEDPTTIEFARLLAAEIGGFVPPPA
jgi:Amidase